MRAWNIDANTINTGEISENLESLMVVTREIKDFLSFDTNKMFIIAPKGIGKTFLLKVKSQYFRDNGSGYKFIPEDSLCESFTSNDLSWSENDLQKFSERPIWYKTWELSLYTLILKQFKSKDIPKEILNVVGEETGVLNEILGAFLQIRGNIEKLHGLVAVKLKPAVRKLREHSTANQIAIFIDNIDESFDSYVGFTAQSEGKLKASSIWINAQVSLLSVARDICLSNHHIKIFATVRSEAYNNFFDPIKLQIDDVCVFLKYSKKDIREIFNKNIRLTAQDDLVFNGNSDPLMDLFGFKEIPHKFIEDEKGQKRLENVFEFIYRHTYGRPRDIVLMGKSIVERLLPEYRKNTNDVGSVINEQSYRLFEQLKNETVPVFEEEIFEKFCLRVKFNVIKFEEAYKISSLFKEEGFANIFSYFYRLGLIGVVENDLTTNGGVLKQTFLPVGEYSLTNESIPEYQYFVLHPSLNKKMKQIYDVGFYDRFNIVGYNYPFSVNKINLIDNHFHFGFDRDSITTILPNIKSSKCLAVLALPGLELSELGNSKTLILNINGDDTSFRVYREDLPDTEKNEIKNDWKDKKYHVLIYSHFIEDISFFFEKCSASSICLFYPNSDILAKLLKNFAKGSTLLIYFFTREYIVEDFNFFKNYVEDISSDAIVEFILFDRFQWSFELQHNKDEQLVRISISAENSYNIIYKSRVVNLFKGVDKFIKVHTDSEFSFFQRRQNLLVEGIYHFLKVLFAKGVTEKQEYLSIAEKFIALLSNKLLAVYPDTEIHNLFNGKNRDIVKKEMIRFGNETLARIEYLYENGVLNNAGHDLDSSKKNGIIPSETEYYELIKLVPEFFTNSSDFIELKNLLEYNSLDHFRQVFISYSFLDKEIVHHFSDRLSLMGINVKMYEQDDPTGSNKVYMSSSIQEAERMLFFASQNSLKSDACHFELSQCFEYIRQNNDLDRILIVCLDNYVLNANLFNISDSERKKNIMYLREYSSLVNNYTHDSEINLRKLDKWLMPLVAKSIKIIHK